MQENPTPAHNFGFPSSVYILWLSDMRKLERVRGVFLWTGKENHLILLLPFQFGTGFKHVLRKSHTYINYFKFLINLINAI